MTDFYAQIVIPCALACIMFSMGLSLVRSDFTHIIEKPKAFALGFFCQLVLLPLIGFSIAIILELSPAYSVGLIVLCCCPGGVGSNIFTQWINGNTALSISLTTVSGIVTLFTIPIIVNFSLSYFLDDSAALQLPIIRTFVTILAMTAIPVAIGMTLNARAPSFSQRIEKKVRIGALLLFIVTIIGAASSKEAGIRDLAPYLPGIVLAIGILHVTTIGVSFLLARQAKLEAKEQLTIVLECGIQNCALGIFIGWTLLKSPTMAVPSAVYGMTMWFACALFLYLVRETIRTFR